MRFIKRKAIITLFPAKAGGRKGAISQEYSPNAVFGIDLSQLSNLWEKDCYKYDFEDSTMIKNSGIRLELNDLTIYPGGVALSEFMISERAYKYIGSDLMKAGINFLLREGNRIIGTGQIV